MASNKKLISSKRVKTLANKKTKLSVQKNAVKRIVQNRLAGLLSDLDPSKVMDTYWIYATRKTGKYPKPTKNNGKWLIFVDIANVNIVWQKIKHATENGLLGEASKAATARPNPVAPKPNLKVICVYTYDCTDKADVMKIREELRRIGITKKIPYKSDKATRQGLYSSNRDIDVSEYYE